MWYVVHVCYAYPEIILNAYKITSARDNLG